MCGLVIHGTLLRFLELWPAVLERVMRRVIIHRGPTDVAETNEQDLCGGSAVAVAVAVVHGDEKEERSG